MGVTSDCAGCGEPVHACRNCRLFVPHSRRRCRSLTTDPPADPDRQNHCEEFDWADSDAASPGGVSGDEARRRFDALFGE